MYAATGGENEGHGPKSPLSPHLTQSLEITALGTRKTGGGIV